MVWGPFMSDSDYRADNAARERVKNAPSNVQFDQWGNAIKEQNAAADDYLKSINQPGGSAAYQQQMTGLGQAQNQMQAQALGRGASGGNERAALYAGANAQAQVVGQAGATRAQENMAARQAQINARQFGAGQYGQQSQFKEQQYQQARLNEYQDLAAKEGDEDLMSAIGGGLQTGAALVGGAAMMSDARLKRHVEDIGYDVDEAAAYLAKQAQKQREKRPMSDKKGKSLSKASSDEMYDKLEGDLSEDKATHPSWASSRQPISKARADEMYQGIEERGEAPWADQYAAARQRADVRAQSLGQSLARDVTNGIIRRPRGSADLASGPSDPGMPESLRPQSRPFPSDWKNSRVPYDANIPVPGYDIPEAANQSLRGMSPPRRFLSDENSKAEIRAYKDENDMLRRSLEKMQRTPPASAGSDAEPRPSRVTDEPSGTEFSMPARGPAQFRMDDSAGFAHVSSPSGSVPRTRVETRAPRYIHEGSGAETTLSPEGEGRFRAAPEWPIDDRPASDPTPVWDLDDPKQVALLQRGAGARSR